MLFTTHVPTPEATSYSLLCHCQINLNLTVFFGHKYGHAHPVPVLVANGIIEEIT